MKSALAVLIALTPSLAGAVDLLPHRAAYRLSLLDGNGQSGMNDVKGGLVMEWQDTCQGWLSQQQLAFIADTNEGDRFAYDVRFSSWESADHQAMRFFVRSFDDGKMGDEFRGEAVLEGGGGEVTYRRPEGMTLDLPPGTIFPSEHMVRLIENAEAGRLVFASKVFDGSGPDALNTISAVIGKAVAATGSGDLEEGRRWPVSLAYHDAEGGEGLPEFEVAFDMTARGVLSNLRLDYGDFVLKGDLQKIDAFEAAKGCD